MFRVHPKECHRRAADICEPSDFSAVYVEMRVPNISSRVEQPYDSSNLRIDTRKIRSFEPIAPVTRQRQILWIVRAAMLTSDDMLNMEW